MQLYTYYRSTAAYRVRIALHYKQLTVAMVPINLLQKEQLGATYRKHNPQMRVPLFVDGDIAIGQSLAILDYLEEQYPAKPLLPSDVAGRTWVRYFTNIIACDMHPLNNVSVLNYLKTQHQFNQDNIISWYHHWLKLGFDALEQLISQQDNPGKYCWGDKVSLADVCLIPQIYNAMRYKFSLQSYPHLARINAHCLTLSYFQQAAPEQQADCPAKSQ